MPSNWKPEMPKGMKWGEQKKWEQMWNSKEGDVPEDTPEEKKARGKESRLNARHEKFMKGRQSNAKKGGQSRGMASKGQSEEDYILSMHKLDKPYDPKDPFFEGISEEEYEEEKRSTIQRSLDDPGFSGIMRDSTTDPGHKKVSTADKVIANMKADYAGPSAVPPQARGEIKTGPLERNAPQDFSPEAMAQFAPNTSQGDRTQALGSLKKNLQVGKVKRGLAEARPDSVGASPDPKGDPNLPGYVTGGYDPEQGAITAAPEGTLEAREQVVKKKKRTEEAKAKYRKMAQ